MDAADTATRSISTAVVMHRVSWLQLLGFPREVQNAVEDLLFDDQKLFSGTTDESPHMLKNSVATLRFLGICAPTKKEEV